MQTVSKTGTSVGTKLLTLTLAGAFLGFGLAAAGLPLWKDYKANSAIEQVVKKQQQQVKKYGGAVDLAVTSFELADNYDVSTGKITRQGKYVIKNTGLLAIDQQISIRSYEYHQNDVNPEELKLITIDHIKNVKAGEEIVGKIAIDLTPTDGNFAGMLAKLKEIDAFVIKVDSANKLFESDEGNNIFWVGNGHGLAQGKTYDYAVVGVKTKPYSAEKSLVSMLVANVGDSDATGWNTCSIVVGDGSVASPLTQVASENFLKLPKGRQFMCNQLVSNAYHVFGKNMYTAGLYEGGAFPENDKLDFGMYYGPSNVIDELE